MLLLNRSIYIIQNCFQLCSVRVDYGSNSYAVRTALGIWGSYRRRVFANAYLTMPHLVLVFVPDSPRLKIRESLSCTRLEKIEKRGKSSDETNENSEKSRNKDDSVSWNGFEKIFNQLYNLRQDVMQAQFLSRVQLVWIQSFLSLRLVAVSGLNTSKL